MEIKEGILSLMSQFRVMKPSTAKEDEKEQQRLKEILLSEDYAAEEKIDGCHYTMAAFCFFSTEGIEKTNNYPHFRDFFLNLNMPNLMLDGEINYPGKTSQYCTRVTGASPEAAVQFQIENGYIHYTLFDMIRTPKGTWLMKTPYQERRKLLEYFYNYYIKGTPMQDYIHLTSINYSTKDQFLQSILKRDGEGIVLKKLNSLYIMGKKPKWLWVKIKQKDEADFFIMGFEKSDYKTAANDYDGWPYWKEIKGILTPVNKNYYFGLIGSVKLGAYVNGQEKQICTAAGIDDSTRRDMSENPENYLGKVVKVGFMEKTEAGIPRHPKIISLHESKIKTECIWEEGV